MFHYLKTTVLYNKKDYLPSETILTLCNMDGWIDGWVGELADGRTVYVCLHMYAIYICNSTQTGITL